MVDSTAAIHPVDETKEDCNTNRHQQCSPHLFLFNRYRLVKFDSFFFISVGLTEISKGLKTDERVPPLANCGTGMSRLNGV